MYKCIIIYKTYCQALTFSHVGLHDKRMRKQVGTRQEKRSIKLQNTHKTYTNEEVMTSKGWRKEDSEGKKKELDKDEKHFS